MKKISLLKVSVIALMFALYTGHQVQALSTIINFENYANHNVEVVVVYHGYAAGQNLGNITVDAKKAQEIMHNGGIAWITVHDSTLGTTTTFNPTSNAILKYHNDGTIWDHENKHKLALPVKGTVSAGTAPQ